MIGRRESPVYLCVWFGLPFARNATGDGLKKTEGDH